MFWFNIDIFLCSKLSQCCLKQCAEYSESVMRLSTDIHIECSVFQPDSVRSSVSPVHRSVKLVFCNRITYCKVSGRNHMWSNFKKPTNFKVGERIHFFSRCTGMWMAKWSFRFKILLYTESSLTKATEANHNRFCDIAKIGTMGNSMQSNSGQRTLFRILRSKLKLIC